MRYLFIFLCLMSCVVFVAANSQEEEDDEERCMGIAERLSSLYEKLASLESERNKILTRLTFVNAKIAKTEAKIQGVLSDLGRYSDKAFPDYWVQLKRLKKEKKKLDAQLADVNQQINATMAQIRSLEAQARDCASGGGGGGNSSSEQGFEVPSDPLEAFVLDGLNASGANMANAQWIVEVLRQEGVDPTDPDIRVSLPRGPHSTSLTISRAWSGSTLRNIVNYNNGNFIGEHSPIVLDLDGDGKLQASKGQWLPHDYTYTPLVDFDINGDGKLDKIEWVGPNDGLLVDYQGNNINGKHLFGNVDGFKTGYHKLATFDLDKNGRIEKAELDGLRVWQDKNGNAKLEQGELFNLKQLKITALHTNHYHLVSNFTQNGQNKVMWDWYPCMLKTSK